ncbi:FMN-dependent NADH-azoreductase ['Osedax' symbiont bacterium Rs2_46_30_T18]|nr:FMN-dependent NADH-azoreductase ['Osedax' symbiont bacterium Rs2_46_30_T18]
MSTANILKINSSGRLEGSVTRQLTDILTQHIIASSTTPKEESNVIERDLATGLPFYDETWIGANFTAADERSDEQRQALKLSDELIDEIQQSEHIVIATPIYNFSLPAVLKAWVDLIARAKVTFKYTENGPVGLLKNKKAYLVMASGGVSIGGDSDFASHFLKYFLAFVGITDVTIIDASKVNLQGSSQEITAALELQMQQLVAA